MFENTINKNNKLVVHKHIKLTPQTSINLNALKTVYELSNNSTSYNNLINISILVLMEYLNSLPEDKAINFIKKYHDKLKELK